MWGCAFGKSEAFIRQFIPPTNTQQPQLVIDGAMLEQDRLDSAPSPLTDARGPQMTRRIKLWASRSRASRESYWRKAVLRRPMSKRLGHRETDGGCSRRRSAEGELGPGTPQG